MLIKKNAMKYLVKIWTNNQQNFENNVLSVLQNKTPEVKDPNKS